MAKRSKKALEVAKFGGVEALGTVKEQNNYTAFKSGLSDAETVVPNVDWETQSVEAKSETSLESDEGHGQAVVIRHFKFNIDPNELVRCVTITGAYPGKQTLFDSVKKGIEVSLWRDGLKVFPDQEPRILVDEHYRSFEAFVAAIPAKGHMLHETPHTLSQLVHGG